MLDHSMVLNLSVPSVIDSATSELRQEYLVQQRLLLAQPASICQQLESQSADLAKAIDTRLRRVHYRLPESVCIPTKGQQSDVNYLPARYRTMSIGSFFNYLVPLDLPSALKVQLSNLEKSSIPAVSATAQLLRSALVFYLVHNHLPAGQDVQYSAEFDDDIPNIPVCHQGDYPSTSNEPGQGFFMPHMVVIDEHQHLLAANVQAAEAVLNNLAHYLSILNEVSHLAPYMVVDEEYQRKRYGILGQLVNQGRALAYYEVDQICITIKHRFESHNLDRGFSLRLPYFNDQTLALELYDFDVVPSGRLMFVPAFLVLAVRNQGAKIIQEPCFNRTTRLNLVRELYTIERAFLG